MYDKKHHLEDLRFLFDFDCKFFEVKIIDPNTKQACTNSYSFPEHDTTFSPSQSGNIVQYEQLEQ